jgi:hypothetical protein
VYHLHATQNIVDQLLTSGLVDINEPLESAPNRQPLVIAFG